MACPSADLSQVSFRADRSRVAAISARETEVFKNRTAKSRALQERARAVMPAGTPMSWMAGY